MRTTSNCPVPKSVRLHDSDSPFAIASSIGDSSHTLQMAMLRSRTSTVCITIVVDDDDDDNGDDDDDHDGNDCDDDDDGDDNGDDDGDDGDDGRRRRFGS